MSKSPFLSALLLVLSLTMVGCATTQPRAYSDLASAAVLTDHPDHDSAQSPYAYSAEVDWRSYSHVIVDPVEIYRGKDHQFEKITESQKKDLAGFMEAQFRYELRQRFNPVATSGAQTMKVKVTLTGAKATPKVLGTMLRFDVAGGSYNLVQAARGKEGAATGSVSYAVEIMDAPSGRLLIAYVAKQYPNAMNVKATLGPLDAAKIGITKAAEDLLARLH